MCQLPKYPYSYFSEVIELHLRVFVNILKLVLSFIECFYKTLTFNNSVLNKVKNSLVLLRLSNCKEGLFKIGFVK